ncbi:MAG: SH3 domain-containing protein [Butyrivibrio sp.]|nr:SH3 domain-containing protein [Butyrivibrio sp.]
MKKKNNLYSFRNDKKSFGEVLGDNKKYLMPLVFILAVIITVAIALSANHRTTEQAVAEVDPNVAASIDIPEDTMEENAYPAVNELIEKYYAASANGDSDTITSIYKGLEETELLKAVAASDYIEDYQNITVYTKPGPIAGSYVAYVYNEVKLFDYEKAIPGLETFYICTADDGSLYINGDIVDSSEIDYLRQINLQADVIDLNNKVASSYNDMVNSDEVLADLLTKMRSGLQVSVGEALASSESTTEENVAEETEATAEASEEASDDAEQVVVTHTIKATEVVNIRKSDSETADILDKTQKGQEFKQLEALANGWSRIEYKDGVAYVKTEFFEVVGEEKTTVTNTESADAGNESQADSSSASKTVSSAATGKMKVSESIRLRKSESTDSEVLEMIYAGGTVNVIEQYANGWAKVEYNKKTGYIKSEFLTKD